MNTQADSTTLDLTRLDVRPIPCRQKHALIFQRWGELPVGEHFVLVNDHDPVPLYYQFAGQFPDAFAWEYLVAGPEEFQVKITRLKASSPQAPKLPPWPPRGNVAPVAAPAPAVTPDSSEVDARGLEPPEPMLRILNALEHLAPGGTLRARTDRRPLHLLPELDARGVRHASEECADGTWITTLQRA